MDYQTALEACRAYKACANTLLSLGLHNEAAVMRAEEKTWRAKYVALADKQQAKTDVE